MCIRDRDIGLRYAPTLFSDDEITRLCNNWTLALSTLADASSTKEAHGLVSSDISGLNLCQNDIETLEASTSDLVDIWPMSSLQAGIAFHAESDTDHGSYNVQTILDFACTMHPDRLRQSLNNLLSRHPALRVSFQTTESMEPVLVVHDAPPLTWTEHDLTNLPCADRESHAARIAESDRNKPFDLDKAPLMRATLLHLAPGYSQLIWSLHHICLLYTSPSPRDRQKSRMPSSA